MLVAVAVWSVWLARIATASLTAMTRAVRGRRNRVDLRVAVVAFDRDRRPGDGGDRPRLGQHRGVAASASDTTNSPCSGSAIPAVGVRPVAVRPVRQDRPASRRIRMLDMVRRPWSGHRPRWPRRWPRRRGRQSPWRRRRLPRFRAYPRCAAPLLARPTPTPMECVQRSWDQQCRRYICAPLCGDSASDVGRRSQPTHRNSTATAHRHPE